MQQPSTISWRDTKNGCNNQSAVTKAANISDGAANTTAT